ncbi:MULTISPECIES: hypothetical protein [unclassified Pseudomonas]|uniref:hypothetical protein n=1 Tax=unclassified Pseudomonas TaxID=196821 RepID=UPI002448B5C0|nr:MULTISPECIES: hypothetical protein [unclassified Pseudomonas]MDG9926116.1 hypothetical protein [Pseudomonas sp. GD04045]MDH0037460.1 hypothetical protein [Pseudomonas sp. GD04019]
MFLHACKAFIVIALLSMQVAQAGELINTTDRFKQKRELKWISSVKSSDASQMGLTASVFFKGQGTPEKALVHLAGSFDRLEFAQCNGVDWLADGVPVERLSGTYNTVPRRDSPKMIEIMVSIFSVEQLRQLAAASVIEYRVCRSEGRVPDEDAAGLRQLVAALGQ